MKSLQNLGFRHFFLKPGELFISRESAIVSTVLGSCVSVTFFSQKSRFCAMCHALLPSGSIDDGYKYVDSTLLYIIEKMESFGIKPDACDVKLFGGADVLLPRSFEKQTGSIGQNNVATAHAFFARMNISPKAVDTGGVHGRKLFLNAHNGDVFVRRIRKTMGNAFIPFPNQE